MPLPWQIMAATDFEEQQLLKATVNLGPTVAGRYYAGVSTTQPTKAGVITELSGNNYARVGIPAWAGAGLDILGPIVDPDYASPYFQAVFAQPVSDVVFPTPASGSWWTGGVTVYLFLADDPTGGAVRWWMPISPAMAPDPAHPLVIPSGQLLIGMARQSAGETTAEGRIVGVLAWPFLGNAIDKLTGVNPGWAPTWYLGFGWGDWYDVGNAFLQGTEPDAPVSYSGINVARGFASAGGGIGSGSGQVNDASYVRKAVMWSAPAADADGWYVSNSADVLWTLGANNVVSGTPIPPDPLPNQQVGWQRHFKNLGFRAFGSVRGDATKGGCFSLWTAASGGKGGPPPSLIPSPFTDAAYTSGIVDDGGDIWAYPYITPPAIIPDPLPSELVVRYTYVDASQIVSVTPGIYAGTHQVNLPTLYNTDQFFVVYEDVGGGSFQDPVSGDVWDPARANWDPLHPTTSPGWLGWGTGFPPTGGGLGYYAQGGAFEAHFVGVASQFDDPDPVSFGVGDQVKVDAGALRLRLR